MRRVSTWLAPSLLTLAVIAGLLLMHGFEAVSPDPLATHAAHQVDDPDSMASMAGLCVFVAAIVGLAMMALASGGSVVDVTPRRHSGGLDRPVWRLRGPPAGFSYERCVIRI